jgi:hypothetical protein
MELTVQIPDDLARSMSASGGDLSRRALEALALGEFKSGHITKVCPGRNRAMPRGVTWSKRMSIYGGVCSRDGERKRIEAAGGKFKYRINLFPRDVELLDDFLYAGSSFNVFEHGGYGHPSIAKYPCAA